MRENAVIPFKAQYVKLHLDEWHRGVSLRANLLGCDAKEVDLKAVCVNKPFLDDTMQNCRDIERVEGTAAGENGDTEGGMKSWCEENGEKAMHTKLSANGACCACGGGEKLSVDTPREEAEEIFNPWEARKKSIAGGTGHLPKDKCWRVEKAGGVVCDHTARLQSATVPRNDRAPSLVRRRTGHARRRRRVRRVHVRGHDGDGSRSR